MIGPAGTFGAFIKIRSPMPSRRAVFDIGVAGPIAGFIALIPVAIIGFATMKTVEIPAAQVLQGGGLYFADPLFFKLTALASGVDLKMVMEPNPFYFAAWVGLLVTALNLIPSGQLDGGHAIYAIFGKRVHYWTGRIAFVAMAILSITGWFVVRKPERVPDHGAAWGYDAHPASRTARRRAARLQTQGRRRFDAADLYPVLRAVSDPAELVRIEICKFGEIS